MTSDMAWCDMTNAHAVNRYIQVMRVTSLLEDFYLWKMARESISSYLMILCFHWTYGTLPAAVYN